MNTTIRVHQHGGPEALLTEQTAPPTPGKNEVLVRNHAIGLNFVDIYFRKGIYTPPALPFIPGNEGAGEVLAVGENVNGFKPGDRVAYVMTLGAYAQQSIVPAKYLVPLPDNISYETAAAAMLKGLTAQYLLRRTFRVEAGHWVLVHAAAGGVGLLLVQWAKHLGAKVIGTVGSAEKAALAIANGAGYTINYREEDFAERVKEITHGDGVHVVYDGIGKDTFEGSLQSLRPFGYFVSYGSASGAIPPFDITRLMEHGSVYATWQLLFHHLARREDMLQMSRELFGVITTGAVKVPIHASFLLTEAALAHHRLESRESTGATVLIP